MLPTNFIRIPSPRLLAVASSAVTLVIAAACSDYSTGPRSSTTPQLSFSATTTAGASADVAASAAITVGTHTLDVTNIGLTITRAELKRAAADACPGDDDVDDDHPHAGGSSDACGELKVGPTTLDIAVNGTAATIPANTIRAGTYRQLELRVNKVELKGTFDGTAFDVTVPVAARAEIAFDPPLVVADSSPANLTVNLPLATWFTNPDGSLVDPNQLLTSPPLLTQVKARILQSLRAIEDRDHDGHDDHGRDGNGGHGGNSGGGGNSGPG